MSADGDRLRREPASVASTAMLAHGGDIAAAEALYGSPVEGWLDLSTGINPRAYPAGRLARADLVHLPQRDAEVRLFAAARAHFAVPQAAGLVAAAGAQALISWLPRLFAPRRVAVLAPTYEEHARAWQLAGHAVRGMDGLDADAAEILVLGNPNNPDGRCFAPDLLAATARRLAARGGLLVVDEAFADPSPELSIAGACDRQGLVVLRSFGKFFGLAGLRLGFAACAPDLAARIAAAIGPWPVSGPALAIAAAAYADSAWIAAARQRLARDSARLDRLLARHGLVRLGGCALFGLYGHAAAAPLAAHLGRAGILARRFAAEPSWLRFGLPGRPAEWRRLAAALGDWPNRGE